MDKLNLTIDLDNLSQEEKEHFFKLVEKSKKPFNPFERAKQGKGYIYINDEGFPTRAEEKGIERDNWRFLHHNYYSNEEFVGHQALRELLNRKLIKFSYENGGADIKCPPEGYTICVEYSKNTDENSDKLKIGVNYSMTDILTPVFVSGEIAERAIDEVVKPFLKEHPDFKWWG